MELGEVTPNTISNYYLYCLYINLAGQFRLDRGTIHCSRSVLGQFRLVPPAPTAAPAPQILTAQQIEVAGLLLLKNCYGRERQVLIVSLRCYKREKIIKNKVFGKSPFQVGLICVRTGVYC